MAVGVGTGWDAISRDVSTFVDNSYLLRILGASNDVGQRVLVNEKLARKFFVGKLAPLSRSGQSEYQSKINPSSYIVSFLVTPPVDKKLRLSISPSFNLYFQTAIPFQPSPPSQQNTGSVEDRLMRSYARFADPLPQNLVTPDFTIQEGRADAWLPWNQRKSLPMSLIDKYLLFIEQETQPLKRQVIPNEDEKTKLKRLFSHYDKLKATAAFIRKRYCQTFDVLLDLANPMQNIPFDLDDFRLTHSWIGCSPEWQGHLQVSTLEVNNEDGTFWGCVARNLRGMLEVCNLTFLFSLDSHSKQAGDECHLLHAVSFFYAMHLTFPEHIHGFISL
jgi:hypothetical protein